MAFQKWPEEQASRYKEQDTIEGREGFQVKSFGSRCKCEEAE